VVEQPAGGGDQDLDAAAHDRQLLLDVDAAVNHGRAQLRVLAIRLERFLDLHGELARGGEDQRPYGMPRGRGLEFAIGASFCRIGKREAGGLAGARLGAAHDVLAGKDDGNGWIWMGVGVV
jgi:hypothetical protein